MVKITHEEKIVKASELPPEKEYWKLTNQEEIHFDIKYPLKGGWVKDIIPFSPKGRCEPGGLYFTDKEGILDYVDFYIDYSVHSVRRQMIWARKVTLDPDEDVYVETTFETSYDHKDAKYKYKVNKFHLGPRVLITTLFAPLVYAESLFWKMSRKEASRLLYERKVISEKTYTDALDTNILVLDGTIYNLIDNFFN